jgi:hypothetical protein
MADLNQTIVNPRTGQQMTFVEISPELLRIDSISPSRVDAREPGHVHPVQESGAEVLAGSLVFEVNGKERRVGSGESISIPADTPHRFWNDGEEDAHAIQFFRPALDTAAFFETFYALAQEGKLDDKGMPSILQLAVLVPEFSAELRPLRPPWAVLKALATVLGPLARARGYRGRIALEPDHPGSSHSRAR